MAVAALHAQQPIHIVSPGSSIAMPAAPQTIERRIVESAREYEQYAPVPRVAFYDMAFPIDPAEYKAMAGNGLVLVTALSQLQGELPVTPYLATTKGSLKLQPVTSVVGAATLEPALVQRVFGKFRGDALFLIPLHADVRGSALMLDFAQNRSGFKLGIPVPTLSPALQAVASVPPTNDPPLPDAVVKMVQREYPGFVASN